MALVILIQRFILLTHRRIQLHAFIVNHNLREESTEESKIVKQMLEERKIKTSILEVNWNEYPKYKQLEARIVRRELLVQACKENDIQLLCIAHHKDDNIETFFHNLSFCSGIIGLSSIPKSLKKDDIIFFRPLLSYDKDRLIATCIKYQQKWVEDPSNQSIQQRTIFRNKLKEYYDKNIFQKEEIELAIDFFQRNLEFISSFQKSIYDNNVRKVKFIKRYFLKIDIDLQQ